MNRLAARTCGGTEATVSKTLLLIIQIFMHCTSAENYMSNLYIFPLRGSRGHGVTKRGIQVSPTTTLPAIPTENIVLYTHTIMVWDHPMNREPKASAIENLANLVLLVTAIWNRIL